MRQGRSQARIQDNNVFKHDGFSLISRDASVRLGSGFVWYKHRVLCYSGLQRGHQENPCAKDPDGSRCRACMYHDGFHDLGTFDEAPGTFQSPGVRADAQCCKITWLEELDSERNTIQA